MQNNTKDILTSIEVYCTEITETLQRFGGYEQFMSDNDFADSLSMKIFQIGELASSLTDEYKEANAADVPWDAIRGMRNRLAHAYSEMSDDIIWKTATVDIPKLLEFCTNELSK